ELTLLLPRLVRNGVAHFDAAELGRRDVQPPNGEAVVLPAVHAVRLLRGDLVGDRDRHFLEWAEALLCELVRDGFVWVWAVAWPGATCFRLGRARHQCQSGHCAGSRQGDSS